MRSKFNFQQFEQVLQKIAHRVALEAVKTLHGRARIIVISPSRLREVDTEEYTIKFYASHVSYEKKFARYDWLSFDVEDKLYLTSNDCTKISFWAPDEKVGEYKKRVIEFIDKIMAEAGVSIEPRFKLSQVIK